MKRNTLIMTLTLALAALLGMATVAAAGPCPRGGNGPDFSQLTPEKQEVATQLFEEHREAMRELADDMWAKHTELNALVDSGNADKKDIQALVEEMKDLRSKMNAERDEFRAKFEKKTGITLASGGPGGCGGPRSGHGSGHGQNGKMSSRSQGCPGSSW